MGSRYASDFTLWLMYASRVGHEDLCSVLHDIDYRCSSINCTSCHILTHLGFLFMDLALDIYVGWMYDSFPFSMRKLSPHRFVFSAVPVGLL